jgi:predicted phage tail protein
MSDTPRTDAFFNGPCTQLQNKRSRDFARELERELATATAERNALRALPHDADGYRTQLRHVRKELARVTKEREELRAALEKANQHLSGK